MLKLKKDSNNLKMFMLMKKEMKDKRKTVFKTALHKFLDDIFINTKVKTSTESCHSFIEISK